ncbi:MAG: hypothetical protein Q9M37_10200 [Desulfonauticus sp.]|nr:hypothetical protein [Desulfonauticus sp.]
MASLISLSIDLSKIDKSKIINGQKGKHYNITVSVNDETNSYGQNVSAYDSMSKEERDSGKSKNYIGNGMVFWTDGKVVKAEFPKPKESKSSSDPLITDDDLPF